MSMQFAPSVRATPAVALAEDDRFDSAFTDGPRVTFGRDREIFGEGEAADFVYRVATGAVRTCRVLSDGRRQIEAFYLPGDCFGLEMGLEHRSAAEAVTDTIVQYVRRSALAGHAASDIEMSRQLWRWTARDLRQSQDHVLTLGRRSATERVVSFLLSLAARANEADVIDLPMSRQDMADYLGLTIETVSRTLTQLQVLGRLAIPAARRIVLRDRQALSELCD